MIKNSLGVLVFHVIRPSSEYRLSSLLLLRLRLFMFYGCSPCTLGIRRFEVFSGFMGFSTMFLIIYYTAYLSVVDNFKGCTVRGLMNSRGL